MTKARSNATANAAKGDLTVGTGTNLSGVLSAGNNGEALVLDSSTSTGLKWGYPTALGCFLHKGTDQVIANATETAVTFNNETFDTSGFHDNTTNNSRITIPAGLGGKYLVNAQFAFNANATGQRVGYIFTGSSGLYTLNAYAPASTACQANISYSVVIPIAAGDYLELKVYQDSGANLNLLGTSRYYTTFGVTYLGA